MTKNIEIEYFIERPNDVNTFEMFMEYAQVDHERLFIFTNQGSQARKDKDKVEAIFPDLSGSNYNSLQLSQLGRWARVIIKSTSGNLLSRAQLQEVEALDTIIQALTATADDGSTITVRIDICKINKKKHKYISIIKY